MNATALHGQDTGAARELYMAMELSDKKWLLVLGDGRRAPSRHTVEAGDTGAVVGAVAKAKARCGLAEEARVHSCYEAGRDGFWLHRWLVEQGIDNVVVDAASIEVNRRARRTKASDRIDGVKLHTMLLRYHGGERRVWAVARVPTAEQEARGGRCGRPSGCGTKPTRTATALGRCWCCMACAASALAAGVGGGGGRGMAAGYRRRSVPRSNAK